MRCECAGIVFYCRETLAAEKHNPSHNIRCNCTTRFSERNPGFSESSILRFLYAVKTAQFNCGMVRPGRGERFLNIVGIMRIQLPAAESTDAAAKVPQTPPWLCGEPPADAMVMYAAGMSEPGAEPSGPVAVWCFPTTPWLCRAHAAGEPYCTQVSVQCGDSQGH